MSRPAWAALVAVCLAAALPFASTLRGYFLSDDFGLVQLFAGKPLPYFLTLLTRTWVGDIYGGAAGDELRPTVALSYWLDARWGAASPLAYHVSNVALHVLTTLVVFATARSVAGLSVPGATFAAALFAVQPVHAETVAWISGRADSIPTLLYTASFLAYARWRRSGSALPYGVSLVLALLALFSKQSAITIVGTLVAYDVLVEGRPVPFSPRSLRPYAPFALATLGYLGLRYALFGQAVRENAMTAETFLAFGAIQAVHLRMLLASGPLLGPRSLPFSVLLAGSLAALALALLLLRRIDPARRGLLLFFGPVWWLLSTAPLLVTYPTPRHLYLAVVGPLIALGAGFDALWSARSRTWRYAALLAGPALVLTCTLRLERDLAEWNQAAAVSEKIAADVQQQAQDAPDGTLLVLGVPAAGVQPGVGVTARYTQWSWALPFAVQPPFARTDISRRAHLVVPPEAYCCPRSQWHADTRASVATWSASPRPTPVIVLVWEDRTGALARASDADDPELRAQALRLSQTGTPAELCRHLDAMLRQRGGPLGETWQRTADWRCTS
jgi:hypothetical protein